MSTNSWYLLLLCRKAWTKSFSIFSDNSALGTLRRTLTLTWQPGGMTTANPSPRTHSLVNANWHVRFRNKTPTFLILLFTSNLLRTFTFQYPRPQFAIFHTLRTIIHILHVCLIPNHPLHKHSVGTLAFTTTMTRAYTTFYSRTIMLHLSFHSDWQVDSLHFISWGLWRWTFGIPWIELDVVQ